MRQGEDFSPSYVQLAQQRGVAKFIAFPTSSAVFPRVCPLTLPFQAPSIPCYHGEWNAGPIQVVGWIGFEVDGWWESLIPPSPNAAPAWFLTFHLPETGSLGERTEKEAGSVLLRCSFSSLDEISNCEKVLRTLVQSLVLKLAEAWMLTWVRAPASPEGRKIQTQLLLLLVALI